MVSDSIEVPKRGMKFRSEDEVKDFVDEYAKSIGFGTARISSTLKKDVRYYCIACNRHGTYKSESSRPRPTTACGCPFKVNVKICRDGHLEISKVTLEHNHEFEPLEFHRFRSNRTMDMHSRRTLELNEEAGLRMHRSYAALVHEAGIGVSYSTLYYLFLLIMII